MKITEIVKENIKTINFDGICCFAKGDPSMAEIICALKRQQEIDNAEKQNR
ncbi:MAG: hypothetical protein IJ339_04080 [Oscillospiraceae bacterium]|nr:hypothetical protein [Oscillospiraceae bacterium]